MKREHNNTFELDGIQFTYLKDSEEVDLSSLTKEDAIVLECSDNTLTRRILEKIRSSEKPEIFLTPIVVYDRSESTDQITRASADVIINDPDSLKSKDEKIRLILDKLQQQD